MANLKKIRINKFCCCCGVRVGSKVIGWLVLISDILTALAFAASANNPELAANYHTNTKAGRMLLYIDIVLLLIEIIVCILLLVGIKRNKLKLIKIWLIFTCVKIVCTLILSIGALILAIMNKPLLSAYISRSVMYLVSALIFLYFLICVWSYYNDVDEGEEEEE